MIRISLFLILFAYQDNAVAQMDRGLGTYPPFTKWYQNPLGFSPLSLHTSNGILLPGLAAGIILLVTERDSSLDKRLQFSTDFGISKGYFASKTTVCQNNTGVLYRARSYLSLGVSASSVYVLDDVNNTIGFGIHPFVRFYPILTHRVDVFFQSGAGLMYFAETFPKPSGFFGDNREGTRLNGSPKYGVGTEVQMSRNIRLSAGLWHIHFSNGNRIGADRNPGHDSNGFSLGIVYQPKN